MVLLRLCSCKLFVKDSTVFLNIIQLLMPDNVVEINYVVGVKRWEQQTGEIREERRKHLLFH